MYCQNCGKQFEGNFCPNCGTPKGGAIRDARQSARDDAQNQTQPLVKKWWFWTLIGITAIAVSVALLPNQEKNIWSNANEVLEQTNLLDENDATESEQTKSGIVQQPVQPGPMMASGSGSGNESGNESGNGDSESLSIGETVLFDQDGVRVVATGFSEDEWLGPEVSVLVENNTDQKITVQARDVSVNGAMINPFFSCDMEPGKKANEVITFYSENLETAGIDAIQSIELKIIVMNAETWETIQTGKAATIYTSARNQTQVFDDSGYPALEQDGIRLVVRGSGSVDTAWGKDIAIFIENRSGRDVTVQLRGVSVNGYMVDPFFSCDVLDGKVAYSSASFLTEDLESNGIDEIETLAFSVLVMDMRTWSTVFQSKAVDVTLS